MILTENKHTREDLKIMQSWSLEQKIKTSQTRILEWYLHYNNQCYVSFSGGKDSTVLAILAAGVCRMLDCKLTLWFSDTGLEYPEIREHVKTFKKYLKDNWYNNVEIIEDQPTDKEGERITFRQVIKKYGYPIISKEVSQKVKEGKSALVKGNYDAAALRQFAGTYVSKNGKRSAYDRTKYRYLLDAPFKISNQCCDAMKKRPSKKYMKQTGMKPIIATMASESKLRTQSWLRRGCNMFDKDVPASHPMSFWTEQDVLKFISTYSIPIASVYGEVKQDENGKYYTTGVSRTGCIFCGFGCHLEKEPNRFQRLKQTHPEIWDYCMKPWEHGGLGMKEVLEFINVKTE